MVPSSVLKIKTAQLRLLDNQLQLHYILSLYNNVNLLIQIYMCTLRSHDIIVARR